MQDWSFRRSLFSEIYTKTVPHKEPLKIQIRNFFALRGSPFEWILHRPELYIGTAETLKECIRTVMVYTKMHFTTYESLVSRLCGFRGSPLFRGSWILHRAKSHSTTVQKLLKGVQHECVQLNYRQTYILLVVSRWSAVIQRNQSLLYLNSTLFRGSEPSQ